MLGVVDLDENGTIEMTVKRGGEKLKRTLTLQTYTDENGAEVRRYGFTYGGIVEATPLVRLQYSWYNTLDFVRLVRMSLMMLVSGSAGLDDLSGPVGIVSTIKDVGEEAQEETMRMLDIYREVAEDELAMPVLVGRKSDKEKFAGARATYSMEAMMQDGKALQAGTSHNFGTNFAEAYNIQYLSKEGKLTYVHETSWGVSTRLIGAIIMTHGDERGLKLPPHIAPIQAVIVPVAAHKGGVMEKCAEIYDQLRAAGIRVKLDDRDTLSPGFKFNDWELKGVPVRVEIGPRDVENGQCVVFRRDTYEKQTVALTELPAMLPGLLENIQHNMYALADAFRQTRITDVHNMEELTRAVDGGFARAMWCGDRACEDKIKELTAASSRNMPFDQTPIGDTCVCCGKKADKLIYFARAY